MLTRLAGRSLRWLAVIVLTAGCLLVVALWLATPLRRMLDTAALAWHQEEKTTLMLNVLRSESMNFLVTRRLFSTVVLEKDDHSLLFGERRGLLVADVEQFYGFDLRKLTRDAIRREGDRLVVRLPDPELLGSSVDLAGMRTFTRQSGLSLIRDKWSGRDLEDELRRDFARSAGKYFADRDLIPSRAEMIETLNRWAVPLLSAQGIPVRFE